MRRQSPLSGRAGLLAPAEPIVGVGFSGPRWPVALKLKVSAGWHAWPLGSVVAPRDRRLLPSVQALHCNSTMSSPLQVKVSRDGKEVGVYDLKEALRLLVLGELRPSDYYWHVGMATWRRLAELDLQSAAPPQPSQSERPFINADSFSGIKGWVILAGATLVILAVYLVSAANRPPLDYEFFSTKSGIMFKLSVTPGEEFPYDEVLIRVTRVLGSDGSSYGAYYPLTKADLLAGRCWFSSPGGVNPYGSDCKPGDLYIIKVPKYSTPLEIECPDSAKGLRQGPY